VLVSAAAHLPDRQAQCFASDSATQISPGGPNRPASYGVFSIMIFREAVIPARDVPDLPRYIVDPRPHGVRELALVRAFSRLDDPAVSDGTVLGK
jgi:hypothetical protein